MIAILFSILNQKRFFIAALIVFTGYVAIFLAATLNLIVGMRLDEMGSFFNFILLPDWQDLLFKQRAPFLFEPIGALYIGNIKLFISFPNIIIASLLGALVGSNIAVSYYSFRQLSLRGVRGLGNLLGTIPAILSGTACCVPTLILVIGLQISATLITVWSFFVPLSILLLLASLFWSLKKIQRNTP